MWRRSIVGLAVAAAALLTCAGPSLAGGWAVTTFDTLPESGFRAGEAYQLGYTIRQHGDKPFSGAKTDIRVRSGESGDVVDIFPGIRDGAPGHYLAEVRFGTAGHWTWEVTQGPFEPQQLGTVTVVAPAASGNAARPLTDSVPTDLAALRVVLPLATLLVIALFVRQTAPLRTGPGARRARRPGLRARRAAPR